MPQTKPLTEQELIAQLQELPEGDALDVLLAVALRLGHWPALLNRAGLAVLKPNVPENERREG